MPFVEKHFWSKVLWGSAECVGTGVDNFREPKICEFEESSVVDQNVFRLQVSVNNVLSVKVFKHAYYLRRVKLSLFRLKLADPS